MLDEKPPQSPGCGSYGGLWCRPQAMALKSLFLSGVLLLACSGSPPFEGGQPSQTAPTASMQPSQTEEGCDCPAIPEHAVSSNEASGDRLVPAGFWCASFGKSAKRPALNVCYSSMATCDRMRQQANATKAMASSCKASESAYCFLMHQQENHAAYWRCYASTLECSSQHEKWTTDRPELKFDPCELHRGHAAARQAMPR